MRARLAAPARFDAGPNMTPLVDVVMVILVFLMLAGDFGASTWYLTSNLPVKSAGAAAPAGGARKETIEVRMFPDAVNGFVVVADGIDSHGTVASRQWLIERFNARRSALTGLAKTSVDDIELVLAPAPGVRYEHVTLVYESALAAQFKKVAFRAS